LHKELFQPSIESEARILLLINAFTTPANSLEGRTKLAKLDFLLRYPSFMQRALSIRTSSQVMAVASEEQHNIEGRMIRYRYGPWDPSYYAILGRLIGKGLVETVPNQRGLSYRTTERGKQLAKVLAKEPSWLETNVRVKLLKQNFNLSGNALKKFIYEHFPEVTSASWGQKL
jgi:DNA-binding PadR family transcriptional regulator